MTRTVWHLLSSFILLLHPIASVAGSVPDLGCKLCNVIFINLDFVRSDYVGLISNATSTPNTDGYFRKSIIFENAYSTAGSTYRGNLSVLTATSPHFYNVDVTSFLNLKDDGDPGSWRNIFMAPMTIAQILSNAGYMTVNLNKGIRSGESTFLNRGHDRYIQFDLRTLIEDSLPVMVRELDSTNTPFFFHYHAIPTRLHRAYYPIHRQRIDDPDIKYFEYTMEGLPYGYKVISDHRATEGRRRAAEHKIYRQQLVYADEILSSLYQSLRKFEANSIIVFFSHHGTQIGDKGIFASNGVSYESSVRVPLMIRHPHVRQSIRIATPVSLLDLVPTIADMVDIDMSNFVHDGISLVPLIRTGNYTRPYLTGKNDPDEYVRMGNWKLIVQTIVDRKLYRIDDPTRPRKDYFPQKRSLAGRIYFGHDQGFISTGIIRQPPWELHVTDKKRHLLYDLEVDPREEHDLSSQYPEIVANLADLLYKEHAKARARIARVVANQGKL